MKTLHSRLKVFFIFVILILVGFFVVTNYSVVFAKTVRGQVMKVERVNQPMAIIGTDATSAQQFSFAIAIRNDADNGIYIASSEDRQWSLAEKGSCVEAKFYPYPPWNFDKADTYFNARFKKLFDCPKGLPAAN